MARVKVGKTAHQKHKKVLKLAKGYRMSKRRLFKSAQDAVLHAGEYAFSGRKNKKRNFRRLWIIRINAALKKNNQKYHLFIKQLHDKNIELDRKILAKLAAEYPKVFDNLIKQVK